MTTTFIRSTEPVIGHHLNVINSRLGTVFPSMKEVAPELGLCRNEVSGYAATTLEMTRGGQISLALTAMDSDFNPNHYQLRSWRHGSFDAMLHPLSRDSHIGSWDGDAWRLDLEDSPLYVDRISLMPITEVPIDEVGQLGHWGWLSTGAIRWGSHYRTLNSDEIISMAWIEPRALLLNQSTNPYFAELTENGWVVNSRSHTLNLKQPSLRPMIAARATHEYPKDKPGFVG